MFKGSLVALVTPFDEHNRVDYAALKRLIEFHVAEGSDGLVIAGTTGEAATLSRNEHIELIKNGTIIGWTIKEYNYDLLKRFFVSILLAAFMCTFARAENAAKPGEVTTDGVGNWLAVWRSTENLGGTIGTDQDILVSRSSDAGATWTAVR